VLVGSSVWFAMRPLAPRVSRLTISSPPDATPSFSANQLNLTMTPDGSRIVYVGNRATQLFVRELGDLTPVALFTGVPYGPFVSPDGQSIGFVDGTTLKRVAVTGGLAARIGTLDGLPRGASWGTDGTIIFATSDSRTGLQRLPVAGGVTTVLTRPDRAAGERDHLWPELLPGGHAVLFTITALSGGLEAAQVAILDLRSGTRTVLMRGASGARYAPSGHLVYAAAGTLLAVPFDVERLQTHGAAVPVASEVLVTLGGGVYAAVAEDGTLAYVSGAAAGSVGQRTLAWVDRQGNETAIEAVSRPYSYPRLSADETRVALFANDEEQDIWLLDLDRPAPTRGTFESSIDNLPVWIDARRVAFTSDRAGVANLWLTAEGSTTPERLTESPNRHAATGVSPDGRGLIFTETVPTTGANVMQVELNGARRVTSLVATRFNERNGVVSPDGRWLAYETDESGRFEIFVRPFPMVNDYYRQVSTAGGTRPLWSRNGQELFYVSETGAVMGVRLERAASWAATAPTQVVKEGYITISSIEAARHYDIARDGRFLMIKDGFTDPDSVRRDFVVVQNWFDELKRLAPTN
jgi:eukaryotic-like serine/threonine-protein kinase